MPVLRGDLHIEKVDLLGRIVETRDVHNLILTFGKELLTGKIAGDVTVQGRAPPNGDWYSNSWSASVGSTLFGVLDERVANDTDRIFTDANNDSAVFLMNTPDPLSSVGHIMGVRVYRTGSAGPALTVALLQGASTVIASFNPVLPTSADLRTYTLSGAEADAITNYDDLRMRFTTSGIVSDQQVNVTQAYLEIPMGTAGPFKHTWIGRGTASPSAEDYGLLDPITSSLNTFTLGGVAGQYVASASFTGLTATASETNLTATGSTGSQTAVPALNRVTFSAASLQPQDKLNVVFTMSFSEV